MDAGSKIWSWQNWVFYMCDHGISVGLCMVSIWLGSSGCCSRWERQWPQAGQTVSPGTTSTSRPTTRLDRAIAILIPTFFPISCRCCNFSKIGLGGCFCLSVWLSKFSSQELAGFGITEAEIGAHMTSHPNLRTRGRLWLDKPMLTSIMCEGGRAEDFDAHRSYLFCYKLGYRNSLW